MYTPVLHPNSPSSTNANANTIPPLPSVQIELAKILRKHDANATRLYDFVNHVSVFRYNATEKRWEDHSRLEGNLFVYERQKTYVFAIINEQRKLIQEIAAIMSEDANKLFLFYEIVINNKCEVFSLHFANEKECLRLHTFINQVRRKSKEEQAHAVPQKVPKLIVANSNTSVDPTLSLKRLLNIPGENSNDNPLTLMPPSAFLPSSSSVVSAEHRQYVRDVFLHLVQTSDDFVNIIHRACDTHSSP